MKALCAVDSCERPKHARLMCKYHYMEAWRARAIEPRTTTQLAELQRLAAQRTDDCIIWPYLLTDRGYAWVNAGRRPTRCARLVCMWTHGEPPPGQEAAHSCGVRSCVNPRHIRWATHQENMDDRERHGTTSRGETHGSHKLTEDQVRSIRSRYSMGARKSDLARDYGVCAMSVAAIVNRKTWAWLQ